VPNKIIRKKILTESCKNYAVETHLGKGSTVFVKILMPNEESKNAVNVICGMFKAMTGQRTRTSDN